MIRRSQPGSEHGLEWGDEPEESAAADLLAISDHAHLNTRARFCGSRKERKKKKNTPPGNGAKAIYAQLLRRRRLIGGIGKKRREKAESSSSSCDPIRQGHSGWLCVECA